MKKYLVFLLVLIIYAPMLNAQGLVFGVEIQPELKSTYYFGYKAGSFVPYAGLEVLKIGGSYSSHYEDWNEDGSGDHYLAYENDWDINGSATLFIPRIGLKFYLSQSNISSYFKLGVLKCLPSVSGEYSYRYVDYDSLGNVFYESDTTMALLDEEKEVIASILGVFGINIGFGCEYHLSSNFSIGGEAGFRYWKTGGDYVRDEEDLTPFYDRDIWEQELSTSLGISYAIFTLNYYWGSGKD